MLRACQQPADMHQHPSMADAARKLTLPVLLPLLQADLQASLAKACEERDFLRSLNDTLLANQRDYKAQVQAGQQALAARDAQVVDLQEQVSGQAVTSQCAAGC
jgi:hypothetical protein